MLHILLPQIIPPGEGAAFKEIGQGDGAAIAGGILALLPFALLKILVRFNDGSNLLRVFGDAGTGLVIQIHVHLGVHHLLHTGNAALIPENIRLYAQSNAHDDHAQGDELRPQLFENAGCLGNEHLAANHAHQAHTHHTGKQHGHLPGAAEQLREHQAQACAPQERHDPPHHRLQRLKGQGIPGALAAADAVEEVAAHQQRHSHKTINQQCLPCVRGHEIIALFVRCHFAATHFQPQHRSEPRGGVVQTHIEYVVIIAGVENAAQGIYKQPSQQSHAVQSPKSHQHRRYPAGKHTAEDAQREKQQEGKQRGRQPGQAPAPLNAAAALGQHRQQKHQHIAQHHAARPAQNMGAELAAPAHGEAVQTTGGPGIGQVEKQGRRQNNPRKKVDPHRGGNSSLKDPLDSGLIKLRRFIGKSAPQVQGKDQQPQQRVAPQQGPAAAQIAAQQGRIIKGSCEQHRPHLPIHR